MKKFIKKILKSKSVWFLVFLVFFYKLVFNPISGKFILDSVFRNFSTGKFFGNVERFSLFYGVELTDVRVQSGSDFDNRNVLQAKRIAFLYNLPQVLWGHINISQVAIESPKVSLIKKNGKWNAATLFPSSKKKEENKEEKPSPPKEKIDIYIPINISFDFLLKDFDFSIASIDDEKNFSGKLQGLNLAIDLKTYRFNEIPLNMDILSIIRKFQIKLNPEQNIKIEFTDSSKNLKSPFRFTWLLVQELEKEPIEFFSKLDLGAEQIPITLNNKLIAPFDMGIAYDLFYSPKNDSLLLNDFKVIFEKDVWLQIMGKVQNALQNSRYINFEVIRSFVDLGAISRVIKNVPGVPPIGLNGMIELSPLSVKGTMDNVEAKGDLKFKRIRISLNNQNHYFQSIQLIFKALFNFTTNNKPTVENPLPWLTSLEISKFDAYYNNIFLKLYGFVKPTEKIDLNLKVQNIVVNQFVKTLFGYAWLDLNVQGENFALLKAKAKLNVLNFIYYLGKSKSGVSNILVTLNSNISFPEKFKPDSITIQQAKVQVSNSNSQEVMRFFTNGQLDLKESISANILSFKLNFNFTKLLPTLPLSLKETVTSLRTTLGDDQEIKGNLRYKDSKNAMDVNSNIYAVLPGLKLGTFHYSIALSMKKDPSSTIQVRNFEIDAYQSKLQAKLQGTLRKVKDGILGGYSPDLDFSLKLNSGSKTIDILKNIRLGGVIKVNFNWKEKLIKGKINSKKTNFYLSQGMCPGKECKNISIRNISFDLPIEHNMAIKQTATMIEGNKAKFVKTYGQEKKYNFSIDQVIAPHPHPSVKGKHITFVKKMGRRPGITARIDYENNSLNINDLRIYTLNGIIFGKNMLFNIGNGDTEKMEYATTLQIKNIDLKQLLPPKSRKSIDDGKIKADLNISGKNLTSPIDNLNLYFSVFKIGEDFGKSAIKIVSPESILTDYFAGSYNVDKINVELSRGLVYVSILFQKSFFSTVILKVEDDKIVQERMPLANFLKRTESEISNYQ